MLFIATFTLYSCSDDESNGDTYTYSYFENSELVIANLEDSYMKFGNVEQGQNLVFEYRFDAYDNVQIADDEYSETIRFEIDKGLTEFSFSNDDLAQIKPAFTKYCFCYFGMEAAKNVDPTGTISGKKIADNKWDIHIDVTFYGDEQKTIDAIFKLDI